VATARTQPEDGQQQDLLIWLLLSVLGLVVTALAVRGGAPLGTRSAPFLGSYRFNLGFASVLAPAWATVVIVASRRDLLERLGWRTLLVLAWVASLAWSLALAFVDGAAGLTRSLQSTDNYLTDVPTVGDNVLHFLHTFTANAAQHSTAARGHPPGPVLLLWALHRLGLTDPFSIGLLICVVGTLIVPLTMSAMRGVCGELAARRYAPVLVLAAYAVWVAVSVDAVVAVLGAAMVAMGVHASVGARKGWRAGLWSLAAGIMLGIAALFSYSAPWLGLSVVCVYFARRRAFLNLGTGLGALIPVLVAEKAGFSWVAGLMSARHDYAVRIEPNRSAVWWGGISLVVLILAAGPPLIRSARRFRNTPGWPFLVGAGVAVAFSVLFGLARGGAEAAWLPFFPWLTVAAVAPTAQGGKTPPSPLLLVAVGALTAVVVEAVLATPW
jgi:hypothetical protein